MRILLSLTIAALLSLPCLPATADEAPLYEFEMKVKDNDEEYFEVLNEDLMWFRKKKGFQLHDARTGQQRWAHDELPGFDGKYTLLWSKSFLLYSTKKGWSRLDVASGEVEWSVPLSFKFGDVVRWWDTDHGLLLQVKNTYTLMDLDTGQEQWQLEVEASSDLNNKGIPWFYDLGDRLLILAKKGPVLIDAAAGTVLWSVEDDYNKDLDEPVVSHGDKVLMLFKKGIRVIDLAAGTQAFAIEGEVKETTSMVALEQGGRKYLFFGFNKRLVGFDGSTGTKLWETAEGEVEGSVRWLQAVGGGNDVLMIDLRVDKWGGDAGTWLTAHRIDAATGQIAWSSTIGYSQMASVFADKAFRDNAAARGWADVSVWFEEPIVDGDNLIFLIKGLVTGDPVTKERDESQGFLSLNTVTGKVNWIARFEALNKKGGGDWQKLGVSARRDPNDAYPTPLEVDGVLIAAGDDRLVGVDKQTGQILWEHEKVGAVTALSLVDGNVLGQIGKVVVTRNLDGGKVKAEGEAVDPFGFISVEPRSGKILWRNTDFKMDPTAVMAAAVQDGILYGCDGETLYAMSLADGTFGWQTDAKKAAGKLTGDKAWAVKVDRSRTYSFGTVTTTTRWSNPRRILRADFRGDHFIVFGEKAIVRVGIDGQVAWKHEWDYDPDQRKLQYDPTYVDGDIVYACKGFVRVDGATGQERWRRDVEGEFYHVSDDIVIVRDKNDFMGFSLQ